MYCPQCGNRIDSNSKFCSFCGNQMIHFSEEKDVVQSVPVFTTNKPTNFGIKTRNIIELVIQCVFVFLLFIPGFAYRITTSSSAMFGISKHKTPICLLEKAGGSAGPLLILCFIFGLVVFTIQVMSKDNNSNLFIAIIPPILQIIFFSMGVFVNDEYYELTFMVYVQIALLVALIIITTLGYFNAKNNKVNLTKNDTSRTS